jgi:hypothetical protein
MKASGHDVSQIFDSTFIRRMDGAGSLMLSFSTVLHTGLIEAKFQNGNQMRFCTLYRSLKTLQSYSSGAVTGLFTSFPLQLQWHAVPVSNF